MTEFSQLALKRVIDIVDSIKSHPFNMELASGSLEQSKFMYYIEQDGLYLKDFSRSLAMIASRCPSKYMKSFLSFSEEALIAEQEVVHGFFRKIFSIKDTGKLTLATISYTSFLLQSCATAPIEVAIASVLPCFWIYKIVGQSIFEKAKTNTNNPYWRWIETYSSEDFCMSVDNAIKIFDEIAASASEAVRCLMFDAFYKSTMLEWHFWNDAYQMKAFDMT